jgi:ubiquinone/menaquinone biosynthesis C-methylase UbiE
MDLHTQRAKYWLDKRYSRIKDGVYYAHQPIYGYDSNYSEPNTILRLARTYTLLKLFGNLKFDSFLDVGGGEGYISALVNNLFGVPSVSLDLSSEASVRAREVLSVPGIAADSSILPFHDKSFDLVLCSEVIEHLSRPVIALSELKRVARKYIVITTAEFCPLGELERALRLITIDMEYPHAERNWFTKNDFQTIYGVEIVFFSQMDSLGGKAVQYFSDKRLDRYQLEQALDFLTRSNTLDTNHSGVVVVVPVDADEEHEKISLEPPIDRNQKNEIIKHLVDPFTEWRKSTRLDKIPSEDLLDRIECLFCREKIHYSNNNLVCAMCRASYALNNGVPQLFYPDSSLEGSQNREAQVVERLSGGNPMHAGKISSLMEKLHTERPAKRPSIQKNLAMLLLRILWFVRRPETFSDKIDRMLSKVTRSPAQDFKQIDLLLELERPGTEIA